MKTENLCISELTESKQDRRKQAITASKIFTTVCRNNINCPWKAYKSSINTVIYANVLHVLGKKHPIWPEVLNYMSENTLFQLACVMRCSLIITIKTIRLVAFALHNSFMYKFAHFVAS